MMKRRSRLLHSVIKILSDIKNPLNFKNEINVKLKEASSSKWNSRMYEDNVKFNNNIIKRDAQAQNIIKSEI